MNLFRSNYALPGAKALVFVFTVLLLQVISPAVHGQTAPAGNGQGPPPTVMELEVADPINSRSGLMGFSRGLDSEFVFKQGPDVNGQEEFSASDQYNTSVEIIGSEHDVQIVKWTIGFTLIHDVNLKETFRLANFLNGISGQDAVQWFSEQSHKNLQAHPLDDFTETKEFDGKKIKFDYLPRLRRASMTVFMKQP